MAQEQNPLYVGVPNPSLIRREILLSIKEIIGSLKSYDQIGLLRQEKHELTNEYKRIAEEIIVLNKRLKNAMPKAPLKAAPATQVKKIIEDRRATAQQKTEPDKVTVLETELAKIEAELKGLE
ncbi:MAG: hypothetical protein AABX52_04575 [Nanoarchaeota archaeon]